MPTLLTDASVREQLDVRDSFLVREDWSLVVCQGDWLAEVEELRPELVVLAHEPPRVDAVTLGRAIREGVADPVKQRILCILDETAYSDHCQELESLGVACLLGKVDSEALIAAISQLLNVPTRVSVRAKVVFELQGRNQDNELFRGSMLDISTGGFYFETEDEFELGEVLYCFFGLSAEDPVVFSSARIVRQMNTAGGRKRYGVEFMDLRMDDRRRIADYVYRNGPERAVYRTEDSFLSDVAAS